MKPTTCLNFTRRGIWIYLPWKLTVLIENRPSPKKKCHPAVPSFWGVMLMCFVSCLSLKMTGGGDFNDFFVLHPTFKLKLPILLKRVAHLVNSKNYWTPTMDQHGWIPILVTSETGKSPVKFPYRNKLRCSTIKNDVLLIRILFAQQSKLWFLQFLSPAETTYFLC